MKFKALDPELGEVRTFEERWREEEVKKGGAGTIPGIWIHIKELENDQV